FRSDVTYHVTGNVYLSGETTIEGGAVIKYDADTGIALPITEGGIKCQTAPYRPAIFTARDDNTVGETITGSTGTPSGYYASIALEIDSNADCLIQNLRISHANNGIQHRPGWANDEVLNVQFVHCSTAFLLDDSIYLYARNVLIAD